MSSVFVWSLLSGCNAPSGDPSPTEGQEDSSPLTSKSDVQPDSTAPQILIERAEQRWASTIEGDHLAAYRFLSAGSRAVIPEAVYLTTAQRAVTLYQQATLQQSYCEGPTICRLKFDIGYVYIGSMVEAQGSEMNTAIEEVWRLDEGEWWLVRL